MEAASPRQRATRGKAVRVSAFVTTGGDLQLSVVTGSAPDVRSRPASWGF